MSDRNAFSSRLPSLDLLKGFEASARLLSFTRAGVELHLTQSAVSRQVQELEEQLGVQLFERKRRAIALTEAGRILYPTAVHVLDAMRAATKRLRELAGTRALSVTTTPAFASLWLIPRLGRFTAENPGVDVRIATDMRIVDFEHSDFDVAIRHCRPEAVGGNALRLFAGKVLPVASPKLALDPTRPLREVADLTRHVLISLEDPEDRWPWLTWPGWLEAVGMPRLRPMSEVRLRTYDQVIAAAIAGDGVALGINPLVRDALRARKLVAPVSAITESGRAFFLLISQTAVARVEVQQFVDWLVREAGATGAPGARGSGRRAVNRTANYSSRASLPAAKHRSGA